MNLQTEKYYWKKGYKTIVGLDEAGRGSLCGSVTAAAVIINSKVTAQPSSPCKRGSEIPAGVYPRERAGAGMTSQNLKIFKEILENTKDSKKLSGRQREKVFNLAKKSSYIKFVHSSVSAETIDKINIANATKKAMKNCLNKILPKHNLKNILILVDGNRIINKNIKIKQIAIVKGDDKIFSIALASIVAKVTRDRKMKKLSLQYPKYYFHQHKGYGTKLHRKLIKKYGPCKIHRRTYKLHR